MNNNRIERAAVRAVEEYIDHCPQLEPVLQSNDKTPIWDGEIYVYGKERHKVEDFSAIVHLQIKGSASAKGNFYRIGRAYVEAYKADRGCVFLLHQQREGSSKLLYAILSVKQIDALLQHNTKTIKIDLKEVPANPLDFQDELIAFAEERNGKRIENTSPKEIESLVQEFKALEQHLEKVEDNGVRYELESHLNTILGLRNDGTVGWRDKFIYLARKVLDLTLLHIKDYDALLLQFKLGYYLHKQNLYHLVEDYYLQALEQCRKRAKDSPVYMRYVAGILNNLGLLHKDLNQYTTAEKEYQGALEIQQKLANDNPDAYLADVAMTLNNLGNLHSDLNQYTTAEKEYKETLKIYRNLAKENPDAFLGDVAITLNNLAVLHKSLKQYDAAEKEHKEALNIRRGLAKDNPEAYLDDVAMTLNNLGNLHRRLNQYDTAEKEYQEALNIRRGLAKDNPEAYLDDVAKTLNSLAVLHSSLNQYDAAEKEYHEALNIQRKLAKTYPDAFLGDVAMTLSNLAGIHWENNQFDAAELEIKEALDIYRNLAKENPDAFLGDVAITLFNMALLLMQDEQRIGEAKQACMESLDLFKTMAQKAPQRWSQDVNKVQRKLEVINFYQIFGR